MRKILKELGLNSLLYLLGNIAISASSLLLLPLYTHYLSKQDYGLMEIVDSMSAFLIILFISGVGPAYGKFHNMSADETEQRKVFGTSFLFVALCSIAGSLALYTAREPISQVLLGSREFTDLISLALLIMVFNPIYILCTYYLSVRRMPLVFISFSFSKLLVNVFFNIFFIVHLGYGAKGMLLGELLSTLITGSVLVGYILRRNGLHFDWKVLKRSMVFGLPFVPALLCAAVMHRLDRYLLRSMTSLSDVGLYGLGYRFPFMLGALLLQSFERIWGASLQFEVAKQDDYQKIFSRVATYFFTVVCLAEFGLALVSTTLLRVLTTPEFYAASSVIQVVVVAFCIYSVHSFFQLAAFIKGKTWYLPYCFLTAAITSAACNYFLLPRFGYMAAAWVLLLSYTVFSSTCYFVFNRFYPIPYDFKRMALILGVGVSLMLINIAWTFDHLTVEFAKQLFLYSFLPAFILFGPYLKPDETEELVGFVGKFSPGLAKWYGAVRSRGRSS